MKAVWSLAVVFAFLLNAHHVHAVTEGELMAELTKLRGVQPVKDAKAVAEINRRNDEVWRFLQSTKSEAFPIVERELRLALVGQTIDQFFVLDTSSFLVYHEAPNAIEAALAGLEKIDPQAEIIQWNHWQLVNLVHRMARTGDARVLPHIDRVFLGSQRDVEHFFAGSYIRVAAFGTAVLMYGATGADVEHYLAGLLEKPDYEKHTRRILSALTYLGSERVVPTVKRFMENRADYENFTGGVNVMMRLGGPAGREALLSMKTTHLEPKARDYYESIRGAVTAHTWERFKTELDKLTPEQRDKSRLVKLIDSDRPRDVLLAELKKHRADLMQRFHQRSLDGVLAANDLINALQYRP